MNNDSALSIQPPSLPKGGGAIQSIGKGWGAVGTSGSSSFEIGIPLSPGRGYAPALSLTYQSTDGKTPFGQGWRMELSRVARRSAKGRPAYHDDDEITGPSGDVLLAQKNEQGELVCTSISAYRSVSLGKTYSVTRYFPRVEGGAERIESWSHEAERFWLIHAADGSVHLYGKNKRIEHTAAATTRTAEWLLEESVTPSGEHILYEYVSEDERGVPDADLGRDHQRQLYLQRIRYANGTADQVPYLFRDAAFVGSQQWHCELVLDYGERATGLLDTPGYGTDRPWPRRADPYSRYDLGFEVRTHRLCRQMLMFHSFAELGAAPVLVQRLVLEYDESPVMSHLVAAHSMAYNARGEISYLPPEEFFYSALAPLGTGTFEPFEAMPGLNDGQRYQLVDLYGEGLSGVLHRSERGWHYREPVRAASGGDDVAYQDWQLVPTLPTANLRSAVRQSLTDLTGDGKLDWVVATPGMTGFFTLEPDRTWSRFVPFSAFPTEYFTADAQLVDLMGNNLPDLAVLGTRSVRLYSNHGEKGFAAPVTVGHEHDPLPVFSDSQTELVAFADMLGTGQQHLIRIRHNEISCWPNLGRGEFGARLHFATLPFTFAEFDASRVRLADLDGSGAADLIYLTSTHALIFLNQGGNGLAEAVPQAWPEGVRYDRLCEVSAADLQGLGCSSLVLTVPHMTPRHWRCDFTAGNKPYLLDRSDNNMGAEGQLRYRSSAQEWLDEKQEKTAAGLPAICHLPFPVQVTVAQTQIDQITQQRLTQQFRYRLGHYDNREREFRGFGLLIQQDSEALAPGDPQPEGFSAPVLSKTWFHTGTLNYPTCEGRSEHDSTAVPLGPLLHSRFEAAGNIDHLEQDWEEDTRHDAARALSGSVLRTEVFGLDQPDAAPYSVSETRYMVRRLSARSQHQPYSSMQVFAIEQRNHQYDRQAADPQCQHGIGLRWDALGTPLHAAEVAYARRPGEAPFPPEQEHFIRWWQDAHDSAQELYYLTETLAEPLHLLEPQAWRVMLPYKNRSNAMSIPRTSLPLTNINYETFISAASPLRQPDQMLGAHSIQRYQGAAEGAVTFEALPDFLETAELDETALAVYEPVLTPSELEAALVDAGYHDMPWILTQEGRPDSGRLKSVRRGFTTFAGLEGFLRPLSSKLVANSGATEITYDAYHLQTVAVTLADGCRTTAQYDYRNLLPVSIVDPNQNTQEALYDGFGRQRATSFYGTEAGEAVGFDPIADYVSEINSPTEALAHPAVALQRVATAMFHDPCSWMGRADLAVVGREAVEQRLLSGSGHLRASARERLLSEAQWPKTTVDHLLGLDREPIHSVLLVADRYPDDPEGQIRISFSVFDGFGRVLQGKQKVEPGEAYSVAVDGSLVVENGQPVKVPADPRWLVSARVEYNNKGLAVRVYQPYFANSHHYVRDEGFREFGYCDKQFYDPLGRLTHVRTARGYLRRTTYYPWYVVSEDENDTAAEEEAKAAHLIQGNETLH